MKVNLPLLIIVIVVLVTVDVSLSTLQQLKHSILIRSSVDAAKTPILHSLKSTEVIADALPTQAYAAPKTVSIPKIGLTANIVAVGLTTQDAMDVPNNFVDVGWYDLGYKPGQQGSVVLDGHYDNFHGQPAVFYYLDTLSKGDQIIVTDQNGKQFTYVVTDNEVYPVDGLPNQQIFASTDAARLNIITCHGQYENSIQTYNQRTVIYSVLTGSQPSI